MKKKIALIMALALSVTTVFAGCGAKDDRSIYVRNRCDTCIECKSSIGTVCTQK